MSGPVPVTAFLAQAAAAPEAVVYRMEPMGWIFMLGSIGLVVALVAFCYWKVLTRPKATGHMHAPIEIDTHDEGT
jgi:hypothetical protein